MKKTVVIGASPDNDRYSFKAVEKLHRYGHPVVPVGVRDGNIGEHTIVLGKPEVTDVHTVSLYLNPQRQSEFYDYILNTLKPQRIIFNPGTENPEFEQLAENQNIEVVEGCTLVMLGVGAF